MKGVALSINPALRLVDVTHGIGPQNVRQGALVLADATCHFPAGSLHVGVVDPGVGTNRSIVYAEIGDQCYIAPDNGLLSLLTCSRPATRLIALESPQYWREPVSATFHGRDIMVPAAAHLSLGVPPDQLGSTHPGLVPFEWPKVTRTPESLGGSVVSVDRFGNLITNITRDLLPPDVAIRSLEIYVRGTRTTLTPSYGMAESGSVIALLGSSDRLEIAVTNGSAAQRLHCGVGQSVHVRWPTPPTRDV
jgi:S-adenosylmethionine hydrolase